MRVQCVARRICDTQGDLGAWRSVLERHYTVEVGRQYVVYGLRLWSGAPWLIISEDLVLYPTVLFQVLDNRLSRYWRYWREGDNKGIILGYPELGDANHYNALFDGEQSALNLFRARKLLMDVEFPDPLLPSATRVKDKWRQCCRCANIWDDSSGNAVLVCPECNTAQNDPLYAEPS